MSISSTKHESYRLIAYAIIGYVYWSLLHGLGPMIWFYPLNELDITGYEIFIIASLSPAFFLNNKLCKVLKSDLAIKFLLILMLAGCSSFQCNTTLLRLIVLSVGVSAACLIQGSLFWSESIVNRTISFWGFTIGYVMLLSSRIWYLSFTPLWNDHATNSILLTCFAIFVCFILFLPNFTAVDETTSEKKNVKSFRSCVTSSLACGAFLFILHALFGEVSIITRYTVQSYPNTGPLPNPWGGLVGVCLLAGLFISMHTNLAKSLFWSFLAFVSSMGLMFLPGWYGYFCGCILSSYITSVWPTIYQNMIYHEKPGKSLLLATLVYLLGVVGMVWCTAYNFVPFGGELARERTYIIIGLMMALIAYSATSCGIHGNSQIKFYLDLPDLKYYTTSVKTTPLNSKQLLGKTVKKYLFFCTFIGLLGFQYRNYGGANYNFISQDNSEPKEFSALIWTFHFGYDNRGWPSMDRAAQVLHQSGADVIALLESDASKPYLGNNDIGMWLGEQLKMFVDFGPSTRDHTWGSLLLSKYPILESKHHLLPSPYGELAPAISATLNVSGVKVDFLVTHMGNDRDDIDRHLQASSLAHLCNSSVNPIVFLGYITSRPGSRDYMKLLKDGRMSDIDPTDKSRFCEYVMYRGLERLGYARISHGGLSDTELQLAKWKIPFKHSKLRHRSKTTISTNGIPDSILFNDVFGSYYEGHWYRSNHHFHMGTPKYFTV